MRKTIMLAALALAMAACGGAADRAPATTADAAPLPTVAPGDDVPLSAGACLEGEPDCQDMGVTNAPGLPDGGGAMSVDELASMASIDGGFEVEGYVVIDSEGTIRLCTALAESFPPQCGGTSVEATGTVPADLLTSDQGVSWSEEPVVLEGTWDGSIFAITPSS